MRGWFGAFLVFICSFALAETGLQAVRPIPARIHENGLLPRVYLGPARKTDTAAWLAGMKEARRSDRTLIQRALQIHPLDFPSVYDTLDLDWMILPQTKIMVQDRCFYDPELQKYTPGKCLDDYEKRYGGVGRVLIWPGYPNIGIDERNQFDLYRDVPGGLDGLRGAIAEIQKRGVKVCIPFNPWDEGTRDEGVPMEIALADLVVRLKADCVFADTLVGPDRKYYKRTLEKGRVVPMEPELGLADAEDDVTGGPVLKLEAVHWSPMSWAYEFPADGVPYPLVPGVDRFKWAESRHMPCVTYRQETNHLDSLQFAFFNGACFNAWENIFGDWNGLTDRDSEILRRMSAIYRVFPSHFRSSDWEPHALTLQQGVFASRFPMPQGTVWTFVNRNKNSNKKGAQIRVPYKKQTFFDLWHGKQITPRVVGDQATLIFEIEKGGFGALLELPAGTPPDAKLQGLLAEMERLSRRKLSSYSSQWKALKQTMVPIAPTAPHREPPAGMIRIPGQSKYRFLAEGIIVEQYNIAGVQFPWEKRPEIDHDHTLKVGPFFIDKHLVTNQDFAAFLQNSAYEPKAWSRTNFLRHWHGTGTFPSGTGKQPVTWVSLEDARAYCAWAGKRLPNDWEWQYAAQGPTSRDFPWGNEWDARRAPPINTGRVATALADVGSFPSGASPFGVQDLTGFVWQMTNEFQDTGNRRVLLRGGSSYCPQGSNWYFPQTNPERAQRTESRDACINRLNEHGNYLLMAPSLDRSGHIGFRCAADAI